MKTSWRAAALAAAFSVIAAAGIAPIQQQCRISDSDLKTPRILPPDYKKIARPDYFMLSLSWSPRFCLSQAGRDPNNYFQCRENTFGMVVHGLWPQSSGAHSDHDQPRNCRTTTPIARATLKTYLCTVPGVQLMQDEWAKHGTCAFDTPEQYYGSIAKLMDHVAVPDLEAMGKANPNLRAREILSAFVRANTGMKQEDLRLKLNGRALEEVHICYDRNWVFRACEGPQIPLDTRVTITPAGSAERAHAHSRKSGGR